MNEIFEKKPLIIRNEFKIPTFPIRKEQKMAATNKSDEK